MISITKFSDDEENINASRQIFFCKFIDRGCLESIKQVINPYKDLEESAEESIVP